MKRPSRCRPTSAFIIFNQLFSAFETLCILRKCKHTNIQTHNYYWLFSFGVFLFIKYTKLVAMEYETRRCRLNSRKIITMHTVQLWLTSQLLVRECFGLRLVDFSFFVGTLRRIYLHMGVCGLVCLYNNYPAYIHMFNVAEQAWPSER